MRKKRLFFRVQRLMCVNLLPKTHSHRWLAFCDDSKRVVAVHPSCIRRRAVRHGSLRSQYQADRPHHRYFPTLAMLSRICDIQACLMRWWSSHEEEEEKIIEDQLGVFGRKFRMNFFQGFFFSFRSQIVITIKMRCWREYKKNKLSTITVWDHLGGFFFSVFLKFKFQYKKKKLKECKESAREKIKIS